ncbi:MAG: RsmE family RNA methyltransferase [Acidobacteriota bacterium]
MITHLLTDDDLHADHIDITGDAYRHLFRARRLAKDARLRIIDGHGNARWGTVVTIDKKHARVALDTVAPANEPTYELHLIVAVPRSERASWLVEKATELGVHAIHFIASARTPRQPGDATLERWRRVARAAVEQSHRARVPDITGIHPWSAIDPWLHHDAKWILDEATDKGVDLQAQGPSGVVAIGPEGGWTDPERNQLKALGCRPVSLGPRILRVETAALAATARILVG